MPIPAHGLANLALRLFFALGLAAIPFLFPLGDSYFALGDSVAEVNSQRYEGQTLLIGLSSQFFNLSLAEKEFPRPERPMIEWPPGKILADMAIEEPNLAAPDQAIGIPQIRLALSKGFHPGAEQHHTRFQLLKKMIIVRSGAVLRDDQLRGFSLIFRRFGHKQSLVS